MNGLIIVDKPIGCTSFDMVYKIRKEYNEKKVGHIGTLDPMASGVLPILIGDATKISDYLMLHDKEYIATLKLGISTDTGDSEGKTKNKLDVPNLQQLNIQEIINKNFIGEQMQTPPMYSAIKVNGKKLYELARQGKTIEVKPRRIEITDLEIIKIDKENNEITFRAVCSKGTYIRVLCEDIAKELGTCGYMKALKRTRVGKFKIEDAGKFINMEDILDTTCINIENLEIVNKGILNKKDNIKEINSENIKKLINGVPIKIDLENQLVNIYKNNEYMGIGEIKDKKLKRKILCI